MLIRTDKKYDFEIKGQTIREAINKILETDFNESKSPSKKVIVSSGFNDDGYPHETTVTHNYLGGVPKPGEVSKNNGTAAILITDTTEGPNRERTIQTYINSRVKAEGYPPSTTITNTYSAPNWLGDRGHKVSISEGEHYRGSNGIGDIVYESTDSVCLTSHDDDDEYDESEDTATCHLAYKSINPFAVVGKIEAPTNDVESVEITIDMMRNHKSVKLTSTLYDIGVDFRLYPKPPFNDSSADINRPTLISLEARTFDVDGVLAQSNSYLLSEEETAIIDRRSIDAFINNYNFSALAEEIMTKASSSMTGTTEYYQVPPTPVRFMGSEATYTEYEVWHHAPTQSTIPGVGFNAIFKHNGNVVFKVIGRKTEHNGKTEYQIFHFVYNGFINPSTKVETSGDYIIRSRHGMQGSREEITRIDDGSENGYCIKNRYYSRLTIKADKGGK